MATKFTMEFDTGNAALDDGNGPDECAMILRRVASQVADGFTRGILNDSNGNRVGYWDVDFPEADEEDSEEEE